MKKRVYCEGCGHEFLAEKVRIKLKKWIVNIHGKEYISDNLEIKCPYCDLPMTWIKGV